MPRFTIYSTHRGHFQIAVLSSLNGTLLSPSGIFFSRHILRGLEVSDA